MNNLGSDFDEGARNLREQVNVVRFYGFGIVTLLLGISQLAFGWMGDGFLFRWVYPLALIAVGIAVVWLGKFLRQNA